MMWKQFWISSTTNLEDQLIALARKLPELKKIRVSLADYSNAGWRRFGPTTRLAVRDEVAPTEFCADDAAPLSLAYRLISVEPWRDVTPGFGYWL